MNTFLKKRILRLYPDYRSIYGPYIRKQDGRTIIVLYDGERRTTRLLAKVKLEVKLGRLLINDETVDHKDRDVTNDFYDNLQVLSRASNAFKSALKRKYASIQLPCSWCGRIVTLTKNQMKRDCRHIAGPFCNKSCRGKYGKYVQLTGHKWNRQEYNLSYLEHY